MGERQSRLQVLMNIPDSIRARLVEMGMMDVLVVLYALGTKYCLYISGKLTFWRHDPVWKCLSMFVSSNNTF